MPSDDTQPIPICPLCRRGMPNVSWNVLAGLGAVPGGKPMALAVFFCPVCRGALNCQLLDISVLEPAEPPAVETR